ncbi:uracil-DNA glycosylase [Maricaulis salignorans]|uniref:Type-5 uracil-DNA glycosylase n=1 Tax=Maricaulis salignorans TaxID=144026 RepID=A0A1G9PFQ9_9PROT|nr:uracil-DNA glycosylase [Maricaulis salignorans]SDL97403.1 uracil-DNA glycosylase, family 4 [Maricaulis salignorans]
MTLQPEPPRNCPLCPRLVEFRERNTALFPDWHNAPVGSFGPDDARLLIVGLAPGLRGANRTGRPFTGDWAGDLLFATLANHGFSRGTYGLDADDGLTLKDVMITNAVRCVPPENKPVGAEANACRPFLVDRIASLPRLSAILALGKIAHDNTLRALGHRLVSAPFGHGAASDVEAPGGPVRLFSSYHCSRYNTNTGRLTEPMFSAVFADIRDYLGA